ncbi:MAG TPA: flagellar basal body rod protein FlgB [Rhizomicrobium sp.]|jgi:flagellar basal-body rod protein FlgB|nr:flagellar basal body rod protein FlgB [Rhizomicrobium sp.]
MNMPDIPLLGMLRERMSWLNARQTLLSQNVANADAPGYAAQDLKPMDFEAMLKDMSPANQRGLLVTDPHHIQPVSPNAQFDQDAAPDGAADMTGNTVSLESEMIKVADTQAQFQAASNIYSKAVDLLRTAIGKGG